MYNNQKSRTIMENDENHDVKVPTRLGVSESLTVHEPTSHTCVHPNVISNNIMEQNNVIFPSLYTCLCVPNVINILDSVCACMCLCVSTLNKIMCLFKNTDTHGPIVR